MHSQRLPDSGVFVDKGGWTRVGFFQRFKFRVLFLYGALLGAAATQGAVITRGPYLQRASSSNIVVRWRTDTATSSRVRYGTNIANLNFTRDVPASVINHEIVVSGLASDTRYYYTVGTTNTVLARTNTSQYFRTHPTPGATEPMRVWVIGDAGTGTTNQLAVRNAFYTYNGSREVNVWLQLGDNAYANGTDAEYQTTMFKVYSNQLLRTVTWPTLGNHDTAQSTSFVNTYPYFSVFTLPTKGECGGVASGTEHYYSFDHGMVHFICLDSMTASRGTNGAMATWLRNDLAATTGHWIIAYWHHPPYTKGSHNSDTEVELVEMRKNIVPILEASGVDLVLAGHSHSYERSKFISRHYGLSTTFASSNIVQGGSGRGTNAYVKDSDAYGGTVYAVAGSSGQVTGGALNHPAMYISLNNLGSMVLDITSNRLDAVFLRETGATNDWFTLRKDYNPVPVMFTRATFTNGRLTLTGTGPSGQSYRVWATRDMRVPATDWTAVGSGTFNGGVFTWTDQQSRNLPARFYRLTAP
jgi:acid phosphatase type 7